MKKRVFLLILIVGFTFTLFGCSPVELQIRQYPHDSNYGGVINVRLSISLEGLQSYQKQSANEIINTYKGQLENSFKTNLVSLFSEIYKDVEGFSLLSIDEKTAFVLTHNPAFACDNEINRYLDDFNPITTTDIVFDINFASIYSYILYFNPSAFVYNKDNNSIVLKNYDGLADVPINSKGIEVKNNLFFENAIQKCAPFSYDKKEPYLLQKYKSYEAGTTLKDVVKSEIGQMEGEYLFSFITPYKRLHSNGTVNLTQNGFMHSWNLGDDINKEIEIFRTSAVPVSFYVTALILGLGVMVIGSIIVIKKPKKKVKTEKNIDYKKEIENLEGLELLKKIDEFERKK